MQAGERAGEIVAGFRRLRTAARELLACLDKDPGLAALWSAQDIETLRRLANWREDSHA
jgi:hypothetical protein